jgi:hypothetical protein
MARRHRTQRIKPSLNVYKEQRTVTDMEKELQACNDLLKEQRTLRKNKIRTTNPEECVVPEKGVIKGGWRYEAKLLKEAARRLQ